MTDPLFTADWRFLATLNYECDPSILKPLVPTRTELDQWNGKVLISLVGYLFQNTLIRGVRIPFHRTFEEVSLRFFVRRRTADGWRRAVVFVKDFVPTATIATIARWLFKEKMSSLRMEHTILQTAEASLLEVRYDWRQDESKNSIAITPTDEAPLLPGDSEAAFTTEPNWVNTRQWDGRTFEYQVEHPRWAIWKAKAANLKCNVAKLYGPQFVEPLSQAPSSAFIAKGSRVAIYRGKPIH